MEFEPYAEQANKSNKKKIAIIVLSVVVLLAAVGGVAAYMLLKNDTSQVSRNDSKPAQTDELSAALKEDLGIDKEQYLKQADDAYKLGKYEEKAADESTYAGVYMDRDGTPNLNVTSESAKKSVQTSADLPAETKINVVEKSLTELKDTAAKTEDWVSTLDATRQAQVAGIGTDITSNEVVIVAKSADSVRFDDSDKPTDLQNVTVIEAQNNTEPIYPTPFEITDSTTASRGSATASFVAQTNASLPTKPLSSSAMYGGDGYVMGGKLPNGQEGKMFCSIGFNGTDAQNKPIVFTAGHCSAGVDSAVKQYPTISPRLKVADGENLTNQEFGQFIGSKYGQGNDVAIMKVIARESSFKNNLVRTGATSTTAITGTAKPVPGMPVCKFGRTTGYTCGRGAIGGISLPVGGTWYKNLYITNTCARPGDSGGAVFSGSRAVGVMTGGPMILGTSTASCFKNDFLSVLLGRISYVTPIDDALRLFPGTKLNVK